MGVMYNQSNTSGEDDMGVKTIDLKKKKITLDSLLEQVKRGKEILLVEGGKPLARLLPAAESQGKRIAGLNEGALLYISDDFDDPLPDEFWFGEGE